MKFPQNLIKIISQNISFRPRWNKVSAVMLVLAVLMPTAVPIPIQAYNLILPPMRSENAFRLENRPSGGLNSFMESLLRSAFPFAETDKAKGKDKKAKNVNVKNLEQKVEGIETQIEDGLRVEKGKVISLAAVPVDGNKNPVNGISPRWASSNSKVVEIVNDTQAVARDEGEGKLIVRSGKIEKVVAITVFAPKGNVRARAVPSPTPYPLVPELDESDAVVLTTPENNLGNPIGQTEPGSRSRASATQTTERYGSSNYSFGIPVASLPGRGIDAGVGITYNSRLWTKSIVSSERVFTYNVGNNWLAPGFELGFGSIEGFSTSSGFGYLLTGPDGTRTQLYQKSTTSSGCPIYETTDSTFIQTVLCGGYASTSVKVKFPDGSEVEYGAIAQNKRFPVRIRDRNGNFISIAYIEGDTVGKIANIKDTLNRYINFHYDSTSDKKLVAVTVPGYDDSETPRQTIRFYYDDLTLDTSGKFATPVTVEAPTTVKVLRYVYFPGTQSGFRYDYSPYFGVINKIWQLRGMTVSSPDLTATGTVTNHQSGDPSNWAAMTHYNYPATSGELGDPLTDVPTYTWRKDDWQGRTSSVPQTDFETVEDVTPSNCDVSSGTCTGTRTTTITAPDGTRSITVSLIKPSSNWDNGLLDHTRIETGSGTVKVWSKTKFFWGQGDDQASGRDNPRLTKIEMTNDAGQTRATSFSYGSYNNVTTVIEHDFDDPGELGTELRRTETTYETGSGWIDSRLLHLPTEVKVIVNSVEVSKVKYEYDNYSGANALVDREDVVQHDRVFNPENPPDPIEFPCDCQRMCPNGDPPCQDWYWVCETCEISVSVNNYRGNVTKVTAFSDATLTTDTNASVRALKYDITGNVVESTGGCSCDLTAIEYNDDDSNTYAYPISVTKTGSGSLSSTTSTTYDFNTGVVLSSTDENGQETEVTYNASNLRVTQVDGPDGSRTTTDYNDSTYPYHVQTTTKLDGTNSVSSWSFINGRGQRFRTRTEADGGYLSSDMEFDIMGRAVKSFNPYTVATLGGSQPGGVKFTEVTERDGLGRTLETTLPDETVVTAEFDGLVVTVTDQAEKSRRQIADALGRIIRVDEPNGSGVLGDIGSPNQPTYYEYDGNDNLKKVTQSDGTTTQERVFKYDSLSRLTHERQVEAIPTLDVDGVKGASSPTKWTGVYKYDTESLLIEAYDARGVKTEFDYDGFNRISTVTYTGESGYQTPTVSYTYDQTETGFYNHGRLTKIETAANGTYGTPATAHNFRYDKDGQVVKHTQSIGSENYVQEYTYNLAGQLTSQKLPSGRTIEYEIDSLGRLAGVSDASHDYLTGITFNAQGLVSELELGNGNDETFTYNDRFQMISQSLLKSSTVLQKYDYSYGTIDDLSDDEVDTTENNSQLSKIEGTIGSNKQWSQRFAYDSLGRLKEAREYKGATSTLTYKQVFDFDRFGNLYRKAANNSTSGQEHPLPYTPIEEATTPGTGDIDKATNRFRTETTYNEAGMVVEDEKFREMEFGYDANGRMVKASRTSTPDAWTVYDGLGNRVASEVNDIWRFMIYDAFGKLVAEYGQKSDGLGGVKYLQQDWQGSVRTVTNANGFVVARTDHQAFGGEIGYGTGLRSIDQGYNVQPATTQGYGLTERDNATGLDHTWFRKNENSAGRWTSPDPYKGSMELGDPQSFNRYSYVVNRPTNYVDPSGLCPVGTVPMTDELGNTQCVGAGQTTVTVNIGNEGDLGTTGITGMMGSNTTSMLIVLPPGLEEDPSGGNDCPPGPTVCGMKKLNEEIRQVIREADARKEKFFKCLKDELREKVAQLNRIMDKNLRKWALKAGGGSIGGLLKDYKIPAYGGIGALIGSLIGLNDWYDELKEFNDSTFEPARQAAIATCRNLTGYQGKL